MKCWIQSQVVIVSVAFALCVLVQAGIARGDFIYGEPVKVRARAGIRRCDNTIAVVVVA